MEIANRRNTYSYKWDVEDDVLPMWVADMDFVVAEPIKAAIRKRVDIGAFGYSDVPNAFYDAYISFWKDMHDVELKREWFVFSTGVVPSISSIVRKLTKEDDRIVVVTPCYNIFFNSIINNNRVVSEFKLSYDGNYSIDFKELEKCLKSAKMMIFTNPNNPTGNIWSIDELKKIVELCNKYGVYLVCDEIHCDIMTPGKKYNPILSLENTDSVIALFSASKCYNLAGLQASVAVVKDKDLRFKVWRGINTDECGENNFFCADAHIAALNESRGWLEEMNLYVYENKKYLYSFLEKEIPSFKIVKSDALYLAWINIMPLTRDSKSFSEHLLKNEKLYISSGDQYGGAGFIRINLATSLDNVKECCRRLKNGYNSFMKI